MKHLKLDRRQAIFGAAASIGAFTFGSRAVYARTTNGQVAPHLNGGSGLIPRGVLFSDPDRSVVRISPDGARLAFLAPLEGVLNLWVGPIDDIEAARPFTRVTDRNLGPWLAWLPDNRHVLFFREQGGDENWQTFRLDLLDASILALTPAPGVQSYVQKISHRFPDEVLLAHNQRDKRYHEIYRVNVRSGESKLLQPNDRFARISLGFTLSGPSRLAGDRRWRPGIPQAGRPRRLGIICPRRSRGCHGHAANRSER